MRAGELVRAGAIGDVAQTIGLGPHRINPPSRPAWFWDPERYSGILCDIGSHQFDQFLYLTGSTSAQIVASQVGNFHNRDHPAFQDFGDTMVHGDGPRPGGRRAAPNRDGDVAGALLPGHGAGAACPAAGAEALMSFRTDRRPAPVGPPERGAHSRRWAVAE